MVVGIDGTGSALLDQWEEFSPTVRRAVAELCSTRWQWKWPFLGAVEAGKVQRMEVPPTVVRAFATARDDTERAKATELFGRVNKTSDEKQKVIAAKRKVVLAGQPDLTKGHVVARNVCMVCHTLHGEGAEIGPDLTGVGRSSLDALLANIIDPNQIIGAGYENVVVETKDGRSLSGRLVEDTGSRIKLVNLGPTEFVIGRDEIKSRTVSEMSLMPEGLENLPDEDFRNLIWYILAPPQDGPLTDEKRQELIGEVSAESELQANR
jgi:putative heme-binding domain-containing protein